MDGGRVGLLDFGEVKELPDDARLLYAKLVVALAHRDQALSIRLAEEAGLVITGVPDDFKYASIHVLFDTNMDMDVRARARARGGRAAASRRRLSCCSLAACWTFLHCLRSLHFLPRSFESAKRGRRGF